MIRVALLAAVLVGLGVARAQDVVVASFEDEALPGVRARGGAVAAGRGEAPEGQGWAVATARSGGGGVAIALDLPAGLDLGRHEALELWVRTPAATGAGAPTVRLRALDARGAVLFQRRVGDAGKEWAQVGEPLAGWRWGDERVGAWSEVRALEVVGEGAATLELDHVRLRGGRRGARSALPDPAWLDALAWPDLPPDGPAQARPWSVEAGAFRIAGPPSVPPDAALERTTARLRPLQAWLDRVAGEAVRPVDDGPIPVLVLVDRPAFEAFFRRLGGAWRATIEPPAASGYALQDLCAVAHDPEKGLDRPVVVHEALHALAARRLRLHPGSARHAWLQEGLANWLQLALHPGSFDRAAWRPAFARGTAGGLFRPVRELLEGGRVDPRAYAQVASLVGFLLAERPAWLGALARDLADGLTATAALERLGTTPDALEADWLAWGRATLGGAQVPADGRHFPVPPEWAPR